MRGARHGVSRLTAARGASPRQVLCRVTPSDLTLFPGHADQLRNHAVYVVHRLGPEITDSRLDVEPAVGLDDEEPIEPDRATDVTAARYPNAARLRTASLRERFSLVPLEHLGPAVERFLEEGACGVSLLACDQRSEFRFALGRIDAPDGDLIDLELARRLRQQRLHQRNPLHPPRPTLPTSGRP